MAIQKLQNYSRKTILNNKERNSKSKTHIPLIEGTLLQTFSASNADDLVTEPGKIELRDNALEAVQNALKDIAGGEVVERVLFTDFVMQ